MTDGLHNYADGKSNEPPLEEGDNVKIIDKKFEDCCMEKSEVNIISDTVVEPPKTISEEIIKPVRPVKGPPPVLATKPNAVIRKPVPPRPPQLLNMPTSPTKPSSQVSNLKSNLKKHSSYAECNDQTTSKQKLKSPERASDIFLSRTEEVWEKILEIPTTKSKETTTHIESKNVKGSDIVQKQQNLKENTILVIEKTESKSVTATKSEIEINMEPGFKESFNFKEDMCMLQLKVSKLQNENAEIRKEISDMEGSFTQQINQMNDKLKNIMKEFEEERAKWAESDVTITRLKDSVKDLEIQMSSRTNVFQSDTDDYINII